MKIFQLIRSIFVLLLTPLLTFFVSMTALVLMLVFQASPKTVQVLPHYWGKIITWLSGIRVTVAGREHLQPGAIYIFAANHTSQFDIIALQGFLGIDFRWLAKKELFEIPVFGAAMRRAGYIPVDRARGRQALKSLDEAAQRIAAGTSVIIFPEGTRSPDGKLKEFKNGGMVLAIKSGVPIVPVGITGSHEVLPKGKLLARTGHIHINIGQPVATNTLKTADKQSLATRIHDEVAGLLKSTS